MFQSVSLSDFRTAFLSMGRENQFSDAALRVLFDYIEGIEEDTGEQIELDVVALCCEYNELDYEEFASEYDDFKRPRQDDDEDDEEYLERLKEAVHEYLNENTSFCGNTSHSVVFQAF